MSSSSVIFIGTTSAESSKKFENLSNLFFVNFHDILFRIFASFIPPFTLKYRKVYVDLIGPIFSVASLIFLLIYGYSLKNYHNNSNIIIKPMKSVLIYVIFVPSFYYLLANKLGQSTITFYETLSLVGYSLYGHLFTLLISFICYQESNNSFFFLMLTIFAGLSSLRLMLIFLKTIPKPVIRLLICSAICLVNILFLIFLHFTFMHKNNALIN